MKDQILPQIPEENIPQTQSMYEQLRKTSQKWFTGSHRRIFTNSTLQHSPREKGLFSERNIQSQCAGWESGIEVSEKMRVVGLMRQQIEIACSEYGNRFKSILQDQARKIKLLGDLLLKNQIELDKKNRIIEVLVKTIEEKEDAKRNSAYDKIQLKVKQNEAKMKELQSMMSSMEEKENMVGLKLRGLEKQYREKLYKISSSYAKKVNELSEQFEERIDKIEKIVTLNQAEPKSNRRPNNSPNSVDASIIQSLEYLSNQMEDLRLEIDSFKRKKYRYQNYKFEEVQVQIEDIQQQLQKYQQASKMKGSRSGHLKSSQTTHATRTDCNPDPKSSTSKTRFLNKYKSLINTRPDTLLQRRKHSCSSESSSESEVEETLGLAENNVERLRRIVEEMCIATPVRIEIDQTGYAKSTDTGMYLVDALGNGFQFTQQDIEKLKAEGLIASE